MDGLEKKAIRALILWLAASIACFVPCALADAPAYTLAEGSKLGFVATQNNAPLRGEFKTFTTEIHFAPEQLESSSIKVEIDLTSLAMGDGDMAETLKTPEWLSVAGFPKAIYQSSRIIAVAEKDNYAAEGTLNLKGKSMPLTLQFHMDKLDATAATATGHAIIMRNDFSVGEGEWAATDSVKNEVRVEFTINATKN
jgi:polyisoprenoid-binding protein YceI